MSNENNVVLPEPVDDSLSLMLQRLDSKSLAEWADVGMGFAENIALHVQGDCDLRADQARQKLRAHLFSPQPAASLSSALLATATGLPAQAVPVAVTTAEELAKLIGENAGSKMATVFHPEASGFPVKLYAAPQAQASGVVNE